MGEYYNLNAVETVADPDNITGFTISGTSHSNGNYTQDGVSGGKKQWSTGSVDIYWNSNMGRWFINDGDTLWVSNDDVDYPWEATWLVADGSGSITFSNFVSASINDKNANPQDIKFFTSNLTSGGDNRQHKVYKENDNGKTSWRQVQGSRKRFQWRTNLSDRNPSFPAQAGWLKWDYDEGDDYYYSTDDTEYPWQATNWVAGPDGVEGAANNPIFTDFVGVSIVDKFDGNVTRPVGLSPNTGSVTDYFCYYKTWTGQADGGSSNNETVSLGDFGTWTLIKNDAGSDSIDADLIFVRKSDRKAIQVIGDLFTPGSITVTDVTNVNYPELQRLRLLGYA